MLEATAESKINEQMMGIKLSCTISDAEARATYLDKAREGLVRSYGLHLPAWFRVVKRSYQLITLQMGNSKADFVMVGPTEHSYKVSDIIRKRLPTTLIMFTLSSVLSIIVGLWLARRMAKKPGGFIDRGASVVTMLMFGTPSWWVASFLTLLFVYTIPIFRSGVMLTPGLEGGPIVFALDYLYHLTLPVLTLVLVKSWGVAYYARAMTMVSMHEDYVMAARGRGIPENKILMRHGMRSAAPAITTLAAMSFAQSLTGDILIEKAFARPGLGWTLFSALGSLDMNLMTAVLSVITAMYCITFFLMDILYSFLDPRISYGGDQ